LAKRDTDTMADWLGKGTLIKRQPTIGGEDFGMHGRTITRYRSLCLRWTPCRATYSSNYAPDIEPSLRTGVTATALDLLAAP